MTTHLSPTAIDDLVDRRLPPLETAAAYAHVATCAECSASLRGTEQLLAAARGLREAQVPEPMWPLVAAETVLVRSMRRRFLKQVLPTMAVAAGLVAAATGVTVHSITARRFESELRARASAAVTTAPVPLAAAGPAADSGFYARRERRLRAGLTPRGQLVLAAAESLAVLDGVIAEARSSSGGTGVQLARLVDARHFYLREVMRALGESIPIEP